jgi:hypothetical protein
MELELAALLLQDPLALLDFACLPLLALVAVGR